MFGFEGTKVKRKRLTSSKMQAFNSSKILCIIFMMNEFERADVCLLSFLKHELRFWKIVFSDGSC